MISALMLFLVEPFPATNTMSQCQPPHSSVNGISHAESCLSWHFLCLIFLPCLLLPKALSQKLTFGYLGRDSMNDGCIYGLGFIQDNGFDTLFMACVWSLVVGLSMETSIHCETYQNFALTTSMPSFGQLTIVVG